MFWFVAIPSASLPSSAALSTFSSAYWWRSSTMQSRRPNSLGLHYHSILSNKSHLETFIAEELHRRRVLLCDRADSASSLTSEFSSCNFCTCCGACSSTDPSLVFLKTCFCCNKQRAKFAMLRASSIPLWCVPISSCPITFNMRTVESAFFPVKNLNACLILLQYRNNARLSME